MATWSFEDSQLCFGNVHHSSLSSSRSQVKHCQNKPNQYQEPKSEGEHRLFRILAWIERRINKYPGPAQFVYHSLNALGHNLFSTSGTNHLLVEFVIRFHVAPFYIRYKDGCIVAFVGIFGDLV